MPSNHTPNPSGLCHCGCGQTTTINKSTGQPYSFLHGHHRRLTGGGFVTRFWAKVDQSGGPDACWPWIGAKGGDGYGSVRVETGTALAHRVAYELTNGTLGDAKALHRCDNPPCCNPAHLYAGTQKQNAADRMASGHEPDRRGMKHPGAKLTDDDVRAIRTLAAERTMTHNQIAARFGISHQMVYFITSRRSWRHVD